MNRMKALMIMVVAAALALVAAAATAQQGQAEAQAWLEELKTAEVRELSDGDVRNMISAMTEIEAMEGEIDTDTPNMFDAISANDDAMAVIRRNGFNAESFQSTVYNVVLAMGALEMRGQKEQLDQAVAQLEAMKGQIPEAQYNYMQEQVLGTIQLFQRAPESNVALVEKYKPELDAIGE